MPLLRAAAFPRRPCRMGPARKPYAGNYLHPMAKQTHRGNAGKPHRRTSGLCLQPRQSGFAATRRPCLNRGAGTLAPRVAAAAMADSAKFVVPAMQKDIENFMSQALADAKKPKRPAQNAVQVVGALRKEQLDHLEALGKTPKSGAVTIAYRDIMHMTRPGKIKPWAPGELARLPDILQNPQCILWDKSDPGFIYVDKESGQQVVVSVDKTVKNGRSKVVQNDARTTGKVPPQSLGNKGKFDVVYGALPRKKATP